jgi:hypothetical protein
VAAKYYVCFLTLHGKKVASCKNSLVYFSEIFRYIYLVYQKQPDRPYAGGDAIRKANLAAVLSVNYTSEGRKVQSPTELGPLSGGGTCPLTQSTDLSIPSKAHKTS